MNYTLFTTTQCPKCPEFKTFVTEKIKFPGEILDETSLNFSDKIQEYGVTAAPVIIIFKENKEILRTSEIYDLEEFLKN